MAITRNPPRLSLREAIKVIRAMNEEHQSREVSIDLIPAILNTKQGSSFFEDKVNALQKFGFIEKRPNDLLYLTDLAMQIIDPVGGEEEFEAKLTALNKIDVLADMMAKYPNGKLPSAEQLKQSLLKTHNVPREKLDQWYGFVVDSLQALPTTISRHVAEKVELMDSPAVSLSDYQFTVPVANGGTIRVSIPKDASASDLKRVKAMIDALMPQE